MAMLNNQMVSYIQWCPAVFKGHTPKLNGLSSLSLLPFRRINTWFAGKPTIQFDDFPSYNLPFIEGFPACHVCLHPENSHDLPVITYTLSLFNIAMENGP